MPAFENAVNDFRRGSKVFSIGNLHHDFIQLVVIVFLASAHASFTTGQRFMVTGGLPPFL